MNKYPFRLILLGLSLFGMVNTYSFAEIYKWVDENGDVHYGQIPPPEGAQQIKTKPNGQNQATVPAKLGSARSLNQQAEELEKDQLKAKEQQKKIAEEEKRQAMRKTNCNRAQTNYNTINHGGRMYEVDPSGERHYWTDSERATKLATAKKSVDEWCDNDE